MDKNTLEKYKTMWKYGNNYTDKEQRIPKKNEKFMFFDDGKLSLGRMYSATVINVCSADDAPKYVKDAQQSEMNDNDWLFIKDEDGKYVTDVFIECSIPDYDDNTIWFVRTKDGGFFSLDIQSGWQGGRLDIDERMKGYIDSLND